MSMFLKWTESQIERIDSMANRALKIVPDPESPQSQQLEQEVSKLHEDLRSQKIAANTQLKETQDRYQSQVDFLRSSAANLENSLKKLTEENALLKEHLRNADMKLTRLSKVNEELSVNIEKDIETNEESSDADKYQYQISLMSEKIKRQNALLKVERLKTVDAIREKTEILEISELEKKNYENKLKEAAKDIEELKVKVEELKDAVENKPKLLSQAGNQDLIALSEHLQAKQRTIEALISEKSSLVLALENEKNEKYKLMENKLNNRVVRQSLGSLGVLQNRRRLRRIVEWCDEGVREFTDMLEEIALTRLAMMVYVVVIHMWIFYWILAVPSSQEFLN